MSVTGAIRKMIKEAGYPFISGLVRDESDVDMEHDMGPGISGSSSMYYGAYDGSKYDGALSYPGTSPVIDHTRMRLNARSAYHKSMQARALIDRFGDMVPGLGLRLEAVPSESMLGVSDSQASEWSEDVESRFDSFMQSKKFTLAGDMTGYQSQRFVAIQQMRDGEYFVQLHRSKDGLRVSFWDPAQVSGCPQTDTSGNWTIDSGIKYDSNGSEVAYNVCFFDYSTGQYKTSVIDRVGKSSGKVNVIHGFQREYPGQRRGYSRIGHILTELEKFTGFELSHMEKAIHESQVAMYVKPSAKNPASDGGFGDLSVGAPWVNPEVEQSDVFGETPSISISELSGVNGRPGSWFHAALQGGEDLKTLPLSAPSDSYHTFVEAFMRSLCASTGQSYEAVWLKFGDSYSASRAALMLAWQTVEIWRHEISSDFLCEIYRAWMEIEVANGRISAPGWADPVLRDAWLGSNWIGFPMPNIDPMRTAKADSTYVSLGATTLDRVARQLNGSSGKSNRRRLKKEYGELPIAPKIGDS